MNLSKIPETRLDNYVNLEGKGILSLQSDLVYLNNDTYPI